MQPLSTLLWGVASGFWDALVSLLSTLPLPTLSQPLTSAAPSQGFMALGACSTWRAFVFSHMKKNKFGLESALFSQTARRTRRNSTLLVGLPLLLASSLKCYLHILIHKHIGFWIRQWPLKTKLHRRSTFINPKAQKLPCTGLASSASCPLSPQKLQTCR